jgi:hypothetical protein
MSARRAILGVSLLAAMVGCGPMTTVPARSGTAPPSQMDAGSADATVSSSGPQLIIPVTGGAPVVGIPLGGGVYLPVTGDGPIVGIPIGG